MNYELARIVIPAEAGIQSRFVPWIPARASYRQLGRNDGKYKDISIFLLHPADKIS